MQINEHQNNWKKKHTGTDSLSHRSARKAQESKSGGGTELHITKYVNNSPPTHFMTPMILIDSCI